jgi:uncharacterized membrane protein
MILGVLLLIFALTLPDGNILRIIFGLPFLLFLPGYALVSALWAKNTELDMLERTALSLGLSIALVALVGFGLNFTPLGITLNSVVIGLFILILILVGLTWYRRLQLKPEERFQLKFGVVNDTMDAISSANKLIVLMVVIAIIIGGGLLVYIALNPPQETFTELFILDENGATEDYPSSLIVNESAQITIVVISHEEETIDYNIVVWLRPLNGTDEILSNYVFSLENEKKWQQDIIFNISISGKFKVEIELTKENGSTPYATNHLWIDVIE